MYTRGREPELAALGALAEIGGAPEARLVNFIHDWIEGKCGADTLISSIPKLVEEHASVGMCNIAFHWVVRLVAADQQFISCYYSLCESRLSLVRTYAAFNFAFRPEEAQLQVLEAFLSDKSYKVRQQIVTKISMNRWIEAVPFLCRREPVEPKAEIRIQTIQAIKLVEEGFRVETERPDRCWVYSGNGPGGAGAVSFVRLESYPIEISFHVRDVERRYFEVLGAFPIRPKGYEYCPEMLLDWDPNISQISAPPHNPRS